jgi:hypothetical protein
MVSEGLADINEAFRSRWRLLLEPHVVQLP